MSFCLDCHHWIQQLTISPAVRLAAPLELPEHQVQPALGLPWCHQWLHKPALAWWVCRYCAEQHGLLRVWSVIKDYKHGKLICWLQTVASAACCRRTWSSNDATHDGAAHDGTANDETPVCRGGWSSAWGRCTRSTGKPLAPSLGILFHQKIRLSSTLPLLYTNISYFCSFSQLSPGLASQSPKKPKDPLADLDLKDFL